MLLFIAGLPERLGGFLAGEESAKKNTVSEEKKDFGW
jgi:hypothetical protein